MWRGVHSGILQTTKMIVAHATVCFMMCKNGVQDGVAVEKVYQSFVL